MPVVSPSATCSTPSSPNLSDIRDHGPGVDLALERAAERDRDRADHAEAALRRMHHRGDVLPLLGAGAVQVLLRVRLGGGDQQADLVRAVAGVEVREGALDRLHVGAGGFVVERQDAGIASGGVHSRPRTAAPPSDSSRRSPPRAGSRARRSARPARAWSRWARKRARAAARRARSTRRARRAGIVDIINYLDYGVNDHGDPDRAPRSADPGAGRRGWLRADRAPLAVAAARAPAAHGAAELSGPRVARRLPRSRGDLAGHGDKRAIGQLDPLARARGRRGWRAAAGRGGRGLALQRRRQVHPSERHARCAGRPQLLRRGAHGGGRQRAGRAAHHQAGRLPGARHRRLVAAAARALLGVGHGCGSRAW